MLIGYTLRILTVVLSAVLLLSSAAPIQAQELNTPLQPLIAQSQGADPFYTPPSNLPSKPGVLLRSEPFTRGMPNASHAWRILYTTTRDENIPAVASAIILTSAQRSTTPQPIIAWAHGTTGAAPECAPSLLEDPLSAGAAPAIDQVMAQGWVLVATDYIGMGTKSPHPYLIGQGEARSVLDAVRAAKQLKDLTLDNRTVVWGHSQGGQAALWTGIVAPEYAPDINIMGIAALAPASDLAPILKTLNQPNQPFGPLILSLMTTLWSQIYPDISFDHLIRPEVRQTVRTIANLCLQPQDVSTYFQLSQQLDGSIFAVDPMTDKPFAKRLQENTPQGLIDQPLLIVQGETDDVVLPGLQETFVDQRCAAGQSLEYRTYPGQDHEAILKSDSLVNADLIQWTQARLAGQPQPSGCQKKKLQSL